jgi:hypothetical protein
VDIQKNRQELTWRWFPTNLKLQPPAPPGKQLKQKTSRSWINSKNESKMSRHSKRNMPAMMCSPDHGGPAVKGRDVIRRRRFCVYRRGLARWLVRSYAGRSDGGRSLQNRSKLLKLPIMWNANCIRENLLLHCIDPTEAIAPIQRMAEWNICDDCVWPMNRFSWDVSSLTLMRWPRSDQASGNSHCKYNQKSLLHLAYSSFH